MEVPGPDPDLYMEPVPVALNDLGKILAKPLN
jgi:hypothetical protein